MFTFLNFLKFTENSQDLFWCVICGTFNNLSQNLLVNKHKLQKFKIYQVPINPQQFSNFQHSSFKNVVKNKLESFVEAKDSSSVYASKIQQCWQYQYKSIDGWHFSKGKIRQWHIICYIVTKLYICSNGKSYWKSKFLANVLVILG